MKIGIDLLSTSAFARIAQSERFTAMVFTDAELAKARTLGEPRRTEWLTGRFCAKEATAKVLGRGLGQGLRWRDIETTSDRWGAPVVTLHGRARQIAESLGFATIELSISHHGGLVISIATAAAAG